MPHLQSSQSDWNINENAKKLLIDGRCMFMRLVVCEKKPEMDVEKYLLSLLFGEPSLPALGEHLPEEWFVNIIMIIFMYCKD